MSKYETKPPGQDELEALAHDVLYERVMLSNAIGWCLETRTEAEPMADGRDKYLLTMKADAFLESALLHSRNLVCFFGPVRRGKDGNRTDDVHAIDYSPRWKVKGKAFSELEALTGMINKRVQHLTAYRVRVARADDSGDLITIYGHVGELWEAFASSLSPDRATWFAMP